MDQLQQMMVALTAIVSELAEASVLSFREVELDQGLNPPPEMGDRLLGRPDLR